MTIIMTLPVASSGAVAGWTITAVLTLLLIGLPLFYLLALTFAIDEEAFDRAVGDQVRYVELKSRADACAYGKDIYGVFATSPEPASAPPLPSRRRPPLQPTPRARRDRRLGPDGTGATLPTNLALARAGLLGRRVGRLPRA
jgi:hypothetical protein